MSDSKHESPCTCNSGRYCHKHQRYSSKGSTHTYIEKSLEDDLVNMTQHEKCGGGRRILRGGFGGDNRRNW